MCFHGEAARCYRRFLFGPRRNDRAPVYDPLGRYLEKSSDINQHNKFHLIFVPLSYLQ